MRLSENSVVDLTLNVMDSGRESIVLENLRILAPGIYLFEPKEAQSGDHDKNILVSGGIHPNEVEGIAVLDKVFTDLLEGRTKLTRGKIMCVLGNINELKAARDEGREPRRGLNYNLNALFGFSEPPIIERGASEWNRVAVIKEHVTAFKPDLHFDIHCTEQASAVGAFAVAPFLEEKGEPTDLLESLRMASIEHALVQGITRDPPQRTFCGWTAQNLAAEAVTLELGAFGSEYARSMVSTISGFIQQWIENNPVEISTGIPPLNRWRFVQRLVKQSEHFRFHSSDETPFPTFYALSPGEIYASDFVNGQKIEYVAGLDERLIFPVDNVKIGERVGIIVTNRN